MSRMATEAGGTGEAGRGWLGRAARAPRDLWWRVGAVGVVALALALGPLARPLALLIAAIVIAEALRPLVERLARRIPRAAAVGVVYAALLLVVGGLVAFAVPPLVRQIDGFVEEGPRLLDRARALLDRYGQGNADRLLASLRSGAGRAGQALLAVPAGLVSALTEAVLTLAMSAYWLLASPALTRFALRLLPPRRRRRAGRVFAEMGHAMGGYVRAILVDAAIIGTIVYAGLLLIGVDFAIVLALVAALGELFPVVGPIAAAIPAIAVAALASPTTGLIVLGFYVAVQQLEGYLISPNVMRRQSDIPQLLVVFALFAGGTVGGLLGALVAIPLAGALRVLALRVVAPLVRGASLAATVRGG